MGDSRELNVNQRGNTNEKHQCEPTWTQQSELIRWVSSGPPDRETGEIAATFSRLRELRNFETSERSKKLLHPFAFHNV